MTARRIVVGISGGIAAFKSAALVSRLVQEGHEVRVALTPSALEFIGPATFAALCKFAPVTDIYDPRFPLGAHIELGDFAERLIFVPATARLLASCAHGMSDDLLSTLYLCVAGPILFAPAMSDIMWRAPAVQRNIQQLKDDGCHFVGPGSGWLSCRRIGQGRMSDVDEILEALRSLDS
jgi:phosphopantothenoylcysteine synthetase/decarboxylase